MKSGKIDPGFWSAKRVFLTGHTGFKGGWLSLWLAKMGARVSGYALPPSTEPSLFSVAGVENSLVANTIGDLADRNALASAMHTCDPEILFHLAAQPLVRASYVDPVATYMTNVMGTAHVLDLARNLPNLRAVVIVTTDKCYENREWVWGYREVDRLGGHDPYSNSKACAELVTDSFRKCFFQGKPNAANVASARAGNVVGGGDWSKDRLVPDIVRGCFSESGKVVLRNPAAVRPWQHVLEPLYGYILLAERLASADSSVDCGWNFGPATEDARPVLEVASSMIHAMGAGKLVIDEDPSAPHEANVLQLDCSKARAQLKWQPKLNFSETVRLTAEWYGAWRRGGEMHHFTNSQISQYESLI